MIDREALIRRLPTQRALRERSKSQQKLAAEDSILLVLDAIQAEERKPDHWESHDILLAIGALAAGMYALSTSYAIRALSPTGRRITLARVHTTPPPAGGELMTALKHVCLMHCRHSDIGTYNRVSCQPSSLALLASST
jgi:hypothetical protein